MEGGRVRQSGLLGQHAGAPSPAGGAPSPCAAAHLQPLLQAAPPLVHHLFLHRCRGPRVDRGYQLGTGREGKTAHALQARGCAGLPYSCSLPAAPAISIGGIRLTRDPSPAQPPTLVKDVPLRLASVSLMARTSRESDRRAGRRVSRSGLGREGKESGGGAGACEANRSSSMGSRSAECMTQDSVELRPAGRGACRRRLWQAVQQAGKWPLATPPTSLLL